MHFLRHEDMLSPTIWQPSVGSQMAAVRTQACTISQEPSQQAYPDTTAQLSHRAARAVQDVEVPWVALQVTLFTAVAYFMIGFELDAGKFAFYWLALVLSCLSMVYFGMVVVCITPNMQMGLTMGATILVRPQHLGFSGSCASMCQQAFAHYVYCKA